VELLKVLLRVEAERHEVAARLIANAADLEAIAIDDSAPVRALSGWRRAIFGDRALALKHGKIALTLDRGKVSIVES
jgi:ribonuclease D